MNIGSKLAALAAFAGMGVTFVLYSVLSRRSSTSSITRGNNNASHSNLDLNILLDSAREYYVKGDYKRADIFFERVLEIEPNHIDALNGKGTSLYRLADYDKAKKCFDKVLKMDPKNIAAFDNREMLGKKRDDSTQKLEKPPAPSQVSTQKLEKPPAPSQVSAQKLEKPPAPSPDSGTISPADPRNPYNDPTLPGYNPDPELGKKGTSGEYYKEEQQYSGPSPESDLEQQNRQLQFQGLSMTKGADLEYLEDTYLKHNLSLKGADLRGRDLRGASLHGKDLSGANLEGTNLEQADLTRCNLKGANIS